MLGGFTLNVKLLSHTENPEKLIAASAKLCYSQKADIDSLMNDLTSDKVDSFIERLEGLGHESPFEHASYSFGVEGVSRALTHQLVRHRLASYSQRSQRYCAETGFDYVIPQTIMKNQTALEEFENIMKYIQNSYEKLVDLGIAKEDARSVLPNACTTRIIVTMNVRELWGFFNHRCCTRAQLEIRTLANKMLALVKEESPLLFKHAGANCVKGFCPEGKMSCGIAPTLESLLNNYKNVDKS